MAGLADESNTNASASGGEESRGSKLEQQVDAPNWRLESRPAVEAATSLPAAANTNASVVSRTNEPCARCGN